MNNEKLEFIVDETLSFNSLDEAFEDYIYDMNEEEILALFTDNMKREILKLSPSYVEHNNKYYFNGEFQDLTADEIDEVIKEVELQ